MATPYDFFSVVKNYNFETLNDKEFENLSRDLLQAELKITFETFKIGRDKGIDLRYSHSNRLDDQIIVQAKHWPKSTSNQLINKLRADELPKVINLKPRRYILTTSIGLSPMDKEKIISIFKPFILSPSDIYGRDDLNNLLGRFLQIERSYHKLWLSSVDILQKIVDNEIVGRSEFAANNIKRNISLYVPNEKYNTALKVINKQRFLVIIGEPGIGKTVLARMLLYHFLAKDYQLVCIDEKISEGEKLWIPGKKQIFYFDDFLGANYLQLVQPKNSDSALINFVERVKEDPKKRLILTSRTTILNQATNNFSKLQNPKIEISKHEVNVSDYSEWNKAYILYNHLYFSSVDREHIREILEDKNYWKIIRHRNFNPRLIEFITDSTRLHGVKPKNYLSFIMDNLNHPSLIWENPYQHQIDDYGRFLVDTLFSFGNVDETVLNDAFQSRLDYEIKNGGYQRISNVFFTKIKELTRGFITSSNKDGKIIYDFFNPSIVDFLLNYLNTYPEEKWRILDSALYIEQFTTRFGIDTKNNIKFNQQELTRLYKLLESKRQDLKMYKVGSKEIELLYFYYLLFDVSQIEKSISEIFEKLRFEDITYLQIHTFITLIEEFKNYNLLSDLVLKNWRLIINRLFINTYEEDQLISVRNLFDIYNQNFGEYMADKSSKLIVEEALDFYWQNKIDYISSGGDEVGSLYKPQEVKDRLYKIYHDGEQFNKEFGICDLDVLEKVLDLDFEAIAEKNYVSARAEDIVSDIQLEEQRLNRSNTEGRINDLFSLQV